MVLPWRPAPLSKGADAPKARGGISSATRQLKIPRGYAAAPFNKGAVTPGACCNDPLVKGAVTPGACCNDPLVKGGRRAEGARGDFFG